MFNQFLCIIHFSPVAGTTASSSPSSKSKGLTWELVVPGRSSNTLLGKAHTIPTPPVSRHLESKNTKSTEQLLSLKMPSSPFKESTESTVRTL